MESAGKWIRLGSSALFGAFLAFAGIHLMTGQNQQEKGTTYVGDEMIPPNATRHKSRSAKAKRRTTPEWDACADAGCDPMPPKKYDSQDSDNARMGKRHVTKPWPQSGHPQTAPLGNPPTPIMRNRNDPNDPFNNKWNA